MTELIDRPIVPLQFNLSIAWPFIHDRKNKKMRTSLSHPHSLAADSAEAMPTLVITRSTEALEQTTHACHWALSNPTPPLDKDKHLVFLTRMGLMPKLPRAFVSLDASRPWMMYWVLCALKVLGEDITPHRPR